MIPTSEEIKAAHQFVIGEISEAELRDELKNHASQAIIEALMLELAATRAERDEAQADLMAAVGKITVLQAELAKAGAS